MKDIKKELKDGLTGAGTEVMSKYGNRAFNKKRLISRSTETHGQWSIRTVLLNKEHEQSPRDVSQQSMLR